VTLISPRRAASTPFFTAPGDVSAAKRILLISYTFPPNHLVGGLRWQRMSAYLAERGWGVDVITVDPAELTSPDWSRLAELPAGTRVFGVAQREPIPHKVQRLLWRAVRGPIRRASAPAQVSGTTGPVHTQLAYVNKSVLMRAHLARMEHAKSALLARDTAQLAAEIIEPGVHQVVVSSGPHHMAHEAARLIARDAHIPFIADFRDVWSTAGGMPDEFASETWLRIAARAERRVVSEAALVVVNTALLRDLMCASYPDRCDRVITVMNGCDDEPIPEARHGHRFVIASSGSLYAGRDPRLLFQAAAIVVRQLGLTPEQLRIEILGDDSCEGVSVAAMSEEAGLSAFVAIRGRHSRAAAFELLAPAALLVDLPQVTPLAIPAKLFEFMQFDAWLLALAERGSAIERLLDDSDAFVVSPKDSARIAGVIRECYERYARGERPTPVARNGRYSRREQATIFLDAMERCLAAEAEPAGV
jgi:glycosyltransferase involved in cell wall biosynthesis